ncbi:MAG: FAD-binding protein, partial [Lachnospiraceae bacterium]|nr:FAD-binding protein [Lachnospiraceae bacterium]
MQKKNETPTISRRSFLKGMAASAVGVAAMGILGCSDPAGTTTAAPDTTAVPETKAPETTAAPQPQVTPVMTEPDVSKYEVIDSDLIIVGAGWAAISAAFQAISLGQRVTIIEKTPYRHGGAAGYNWDLYIPFFKDQALMTYAASINEDKSQNVKAWYNCISTDPYFD